MRKEIEVFICALAASVLCACGEENQNATVNDVQSATQTSAAEESVTTAEVTQITVDEAYSEEPIWIVSNDEIVVPWVGFAWAQSWTENGWLAADGVSLSMQLPDISSELPVVTYSEDFAVEYGEGVSISGLSVYNDSFKEVYHNVDLSYFEELSKGTYYIAITVSEQGNYIEAEKKYEMAGYHCAYRLVVQTDGQEADASESETASAGTEFIERQLAIDEVQEFEDYLNRIDNYGFMLSMYESPSEVDLEQVLYVGAGMEMPQMSEAECQAYLKTTGMEEIYTDVTHLTTAQIESFLQEKLGVSLQDMESEFSWTYVPEYDSYYHQAGDTNWMSWDCVSGRETAEGTYVLKVDCPYDYAYDCEVTLKEAGDGYQFISNQPREYLIVPEDGLHTELTWQQAYTGIVEDIGPGWEGFELIYLNEDEIPELVAIGASQAAGCRIYNYESGVVYETQLNRLNFTYIERENLLCNSDGNMDHYYDIVYSIINGRMTQIATGRFGVDDAVGMQVDEEGNLIYKYTWNEVDMSKDEYAQALNAVYDISKAREGYQWEGWYGKKEIIEELR